MANHERARSVTPRYEAPPHLADVGDGTAESSGDRHLDAVFVAVATEADEARDVREDLLGLPAEVLPLRDQLAHEVDAVDVVRVDADDPQLLGHAHDVVVDLAGCTRVLDPDQAVEARDERLVLTALVDGEASEGGGGGGCGHGSHARFRSCRWYRRGAPSQTTRLIKLYTNITKMSINKTYL